MGVFRASLALVVAVVKASSQQTVENLILLQQHAALVGKSSFEEAEVSHGTVSSTHVGESAPLSESGYQFVASLKDDLEMKMYIHRLVQSEARYIAEEGKGDLNGLVPYYSGTQGVKNLASLKEELRNKPWVADGVGRTAAINEVGYQSVVAKKSKAHMKAFMRRILSQVNKKVDDEAALSGLVPYYNGEISVQDIESLKRELYSVPWGLPRTD